MHKFLLFAFFLEMIALGPKKPITVFMAGDSTMANKPLESPERGWGQLFPLMFDETVRIDNRGANGRSTKTFILENRWQAIMDTIRPGDYVFIQFGHNDQAKDKPERYTPPDEYKANLIRFVRETRAKKAKPVLCTPVARRNFDTQGKVTNPHGVYPDLVKEVAAAFKVPMIDMFQKTKKLAESYGPEASKSLFLWVEPGKNAFFPDGRQDNTHYNELGATKAAELAAESIRELKLPLAKRLK